nr:unnamed protein product [Callosobruchus analis]
MCIFLPESDNDSTTTFSPTKSANRVVTVKTLEDIRIEKIQAESAALYYESGGVNDLRSRIADRMRNPVRKVSLQHLDWTKTDNIRHQKRLNDDQIASLLGDGSLRKKRKIVVANGDGNLKILLGRKLSTSQVSVTITPKSRMVSETCDAKDNVSDIKIKTLAEIRAERQRKDKEEAEVSSTSAGYTPTVDQDYAPVQYEVEKQSTSPKKRIKLKRSQQAIADDNSYNKTSRKRYDEDDEDILEDNLLQDSDSDDLDVNLNADEDLLLEVDNFSDK